jgi:hypothetical protein
MWTSQLLWVGVVVVAGASLPLPAQQVDADSNESAKTTYAPAPAGFGDESASRSWEMMDVTGQLQGKLDSKAAKAGDRVVLKIADKVQSADGTTIAKGTLLVGHITEVQAHDSDRAIAQIAIAFDRAEMKGGQSVPVHSLIRTVRPSGSEMRMSGLDSDSPTGMGSGRLAGARGEYGGGMGGGSGNVDTLGANGSVTDDAGRLGGGAVNGTVDRNGYPTATGADGGLGSVGSARSGASASENSEVQLAGHGDQPISGGAHSAAAARAVPRATGMPGVMLAGTSTASGVLIDADRKDIQFESGTRFVMGVIVDR